MTRMVQPEYSQPVTIRLVIITRQRLDGDALAALVHAHANYSVLCTTTSIKIALAVSEHRRPDLLLMGADVMDQQDGPTIASMVAQLGTLPILLLDDEVNNGRLAAILNLPRVGYFTRGAPFSNLTVGIRRMVDGDRAFDPAVENRIHRTPHGWQFRADQNGSHISLLTPREIDVLKLVALGHSVKKCAEMLGLAPSTVDNHKARLMKKLDVHKALDLTRFAIREGLVQN